MQALLDLKTQKVFFSLPECNTLNGLVSEVFIRFFVETVGHYSLFLTQNEKGERVFQREAFRKSVASKSIRRFLEVFMESQMFAGFIQDRELRKCRAKGKVREAWGWGQWALFSNSSVNSRAEEPSTVMGGWRGGLVSMPLVAQSLLIQGKGPS